MDPVLEGRAWSLPASCLYTNQLSAWTDITPSFRQVNLHGLQASLSCPDLEYESNMLRRLVYKNSSQHRGSGLMRRLRLVTRQLCLLEGLRLQGAISDLGAMTKLAASLASHQPASKQAAAVGTRQVHRVPCQEAVMLVMRRLLGGCQLLQGLVGSCLEAAGQAVAQVAKTFFMPLCIAAIAMLARIQALSMQQLQCCVSAYNSLAELLPLLPAATGSDRSPIPTMPALQESLQCVFIGLTPCVTAEAGLAGAASASSHGGVPEWVEQRGKQLWDELGLMQGLEAVYVGPPAALETQGGDQAEEHAGLDVQASDAAAQPHGARLVSGSSQGDALKQGLEPARRTSRRQHAAISSDKRLASGKGVAGCSQGEASRGAGTTTKSPRQSFFDLISSTRQAPSGTAGTLGRASQAHAPFVDRGSSKRSRPGTAKGMLPEPGSVPPDTQVVPVYATAIAGFALGMPTSAAEQPVKQGNETVTATASVPGMQVQPAKEVC